MVITFVLPTVPNMFITLKLDSGSAGVHLCSRFWTHARHSKDFQEWDSHQQMYVGKSDITNKGSPVWLHF